MELVPIYFSCLGECCYGVLLLSSRNIFSNTKLHPAFCCPGDEWIITVFFIFGELFLQLFVASSTIACVKTKQAIWSGQNKNKLIHCSVLTKMVFSLMFRHTVFRFASARYHWHYLIYLCLFCNDKSKCALWERPLWQRWCLFKETLKQILNSICQKLEITLESQRCWYTVQPQISQLSEVSWWRSNCSIQHQLMAHKGEAIKSRC